MKKTETNIVRIDKGNGAVRPTDRAEVERIVRLNYHDFDLAMEIFDEGGRVQSLFAFYEIRREQEAAR